MHAFYPLAPVVILAQCADFSAFGWLCWCHPTYEQRGQFCRRSGKCLWRWCAL